MYEHFDVRVRKHSSTLLLNAFVFEKFFLQFQLAYPLLQFVE